MVRRAVTVFSASIVWRSLLLMFACPDPSAARRSREVYPCPSCPREVYDTLDRKLTSFISSSVAKRLPRR